MKKTLHEGLEARFQGELSTTIKSKLDEVKTSEMSEISENVAICILHEGTGPYLDQPGETVGHKLLALYAKLFRKKFTWLGQPENDTNTVSLKTPVKDTDAGEAEEETHQFKKKVKINEEYVALHTITGAAKVKTHGDEMDNWAKELSNKHSAHFGTIGKRLHKTLVTTKDVHPDIIRDVIVNAEHKYGKGAIKASAALSKDNSFVNRKEPEIEKPSAPKKRAPRAKPASVPKHSAPKLNAVPNPVTNADRFHPISKPSLTDRLRSIFKKER
jgi:hypothetical protein